MEPAVKDFSVGCLVWVLVIAVGVLLLRYCEMALVVILACVGVIGALIGIPMLGSFIYLKVKEAFRRYKLGKQYEEELRRRKYEDTTI